VGLGPTADSGRLRVIEVGTGLTGSVCGRLFAGLGHDVVHCELPGGDVLRHQPPLSQAGDGLAFATVNAGKSSVLVAEGEAGRRTVRELLDRADVAILDMTPRAALALELRPGVLRRDFPELVAVWITGFGLDGMQSELPADSLLAEAYSGLATMIGEPGQKPLGLGGEQTAYCSAVSGFLGAMLALRRRDGGSGGDLVEVAMCDVAAYMDWKSDLGFWMTGQPPRRSGVNPGDWRLVRARDGWVGFIFQSQHWAALTELIRAPELRDPALKDDLTRRARGEQWWPAVEHWALQRGAEEVYRLAQAHGLPFGWVVKPSDLIRSEQLLDRGFIVPDTDGTSPAVGTPVRAAGLPWQHGRAPRPGQEAALPARGAEPRPAGGSLARPAGQPLAGVVVLDFGTITAGAAVTRLLADYGATVLKIEWPGRPDTFRSWKMPADAAGAQSLDSPYFPSNNVGKLGVAINLKSAEGRDIVRQLARHAQVMVENYRVGVARRLGIDAETLTAVNPELLYLSLSSQGQTGPESGNSSYGSTLDLLSGLASLTGYASGHPLWSSSDVNYPDQLVSLFGAAFLAYGLQRGLRGLHLDVSQREVVSWTLGVEIADYLVNGHDGEPTGNRRPGRTPHDTYPCGDPGQWMAISCVCDAERQALASCIGAADLENRDAAWWRDNAEAVDARVSAWTRQLTREEAAVRLRAAGVAAVPVLDAADRARTPRFAQRQVVYRDSGMPVKGLPFLMHEHQPRPCLHAPALGEHTRTVLREICGFADPAIDDYHARGIIFCAPPAETAVTSTRA